MNDTPPVSAPTRVCRHCSAQFSEPGKKCPHCGKKLKKRGFGFYALIFIGICMLLFGGCIALIGGAANEVDKELKKEAAKGITPAQFKSIKPKSTRAQVEKALGKPSDVQEMDIDVSEFSDKETQSNDCIYYQKKGEIASLYQLCFTDDVLSSTSSY